MRILYCNKYSYPFSGTEVYLFELMEMMRARGHEVALFSMADPRFGPQEYAQYFVSKIDFKSRAGLWTKARSAAHAIYSTEARQKIRAMIRDFHPDVAHVRNIYHHLSPSILWELKAQGVPVLYHLNDFKLLCPSYNLLFNGESCEACKGGGFWHALRKQCYPGLAARMTLTAEAYAHRWLRTYRECVDLFLSPSRFVRDKFVEHGWEAAKFEQLQHFQSVDAIPDFQPQAEAPILYVGRLSAEKGVDDLLQAMKEVPRVRLKIAGDGPDKDRLERLAAELELTNVDFVGSLAPLERDRLIAQSKFTVFPSHAYETFGKTILESFAQGRPVIATDLGSRRELVRDGETGLLYRCGDVSELAQAIRMLASAPDLAESMGRTAWELTKKRHSPEEHYEKLCGIYHRLASGEKWRERRVIANGGAIRRALSRGRFGIEKLPEAHARRLRVAFIGGRGVISKYSGIESYYEEVGKRLAAMGHEVTIYCRNYFTPDLPEYEGMRLVRLPAIRSKHFETLTHTFLSTAHALIGKYDLVHYHALGPALFSFLPRLTGSKTLVTVQGLDWQRKKWGKFASTVLRLGERASVRFPSRTMVVSRALQQRYGERHSVHSIYIPNGGLLRERQQPKQIIDWGLDPGNYVLFLGRFSPEKGCHLLVEAFEQLDTPVKLVLAGGSNYYDEYNRELRMHACDQIRMLDYVSGETLDELLTNAMIFVLPSDLEGLSLALLDAMGAGLCVLTSDVPENREVLQGTGFTFQRGSAADLAERLRFLIANPAVRAAAGKLARARIEQHYQWQKIAEEIEQEYFQVLGWKGRESTPAAEKTISLEESELEQRAV